MIIAAAPLAGIRRGPLAVLIGTIGAAIGVVAGVAITDLVPLGFGPGSVLGPGVALLGLSVRSGSDRSNDIERLTAELREFVSRLGDSPLSPANDDGVGRRDVDDPVDFTIDRDDEIGRLSEAVDDLAATVRERERQRAESECYRRELYRITSDPEQPDEEKIRQLLELGCERLGVETGLIARIDESDDRYEIETAVGREGELEGTVLDLSKTYCQETIASDDILGVYDAAATGWEDHPAADQLDINCYVGGKLVVEDELYGTLCFVSHDSRSHPFTAAEKSFLDLMTRWVNQSIERRRYVRAIEERERRLERAHSFTEDMLDAVDDVVYLLDEDGELERWNESLCEVTGYSDAEIESMHALDFFDEEDHERVASAIDRTFETGDAAIEVAFQTKWGEQIPYEFVASVLEEPSGQTVLAGIGRDVSERKRKEQRLERHEAFMDDVLDALDDVFYILHEDGSFRRWNETVAAVTGYSNREIADMNALEFFDEENRPIVRDSMEEAFETGDTHIQAQLRTKSGELIPYEFIASVLEDPDGRPVEVGIGRDISDRVETERRLRERERELERYREYTDDVLDAIDDVFYVIGEDGELQRWNESLCEATGYSDAEIESMHALDFFVEDDQDRIASAIEEVFETEFTRVEGTVVTKDGDTVPYEFVATALEDPDGNPVVTGIGRDISERIARDRNLERTRRMLSQAQRMANVGAWELDATDDSLELTWTDEVYRIHDVPIGDPIDTDRALEFYHPDDRHRIERAVDRALDAGESYDLELRLITADGDRRWVRTIGEPVFDGDEPVKIQGSIQDITERKERERELERTSGILRQTQRIAGVGGWELDISGEPPYDGVWTDQMYEIYECDPEELEEGETGPSLAEGHQHTHPADRERLEALFQEAIETGESFTTEHRIITEKENERWVRLIAEPSDDGETIRGALLDFTERKERERALERTADLLEQAQRIAGVAGWELDLRPEGNELTVTDELYQLFGVSPETEISPDDSLAFYHPEDRPVVMDSIRAATRNGESYDLEVRMFPADGSKQWMRFIGEPVFEDGEVVAIRGSLQDITERKEREQELERFETIIQALDEAVYTLDAEGRFTFVNDAITSILGYEPAELIGEPAATVIPPDDVESAQAMIRELLRSDDPSRTVEIALETVDGDLIDVENHIALLPMADGEFAGTAGVVRDITDRKERERRLKTTSARLEALFENSPDMVDVLDPTGTIVDANRRLAEKLGYTEDELVGTNIWKYEQLFDEDEVLTLLTDLSVGERRRFEGRYRRRDGSTFPIEVHLIRIDLENENRFIAISRDITDRKERERDLRETKRRLELALEGTNMGVWEWNPETDAVTWNETLERLIGLEPGTFEGTFEAFRRRVHPDDVPRIETEIDRALETDGLLQTEFRMRHEDGSWIWLGARGRSVSDDGDRRMVGIHNDITQRKEHEFALESLHTVARDLLGADTEDEVAALVVETAAEILAASGVAVYRLDSAVNRLVPIAHTDEFGTLCDGGQSVPVGDGDSVIWNTYVSGAGTVVDDPALLDRSRIFGSDVENGVVVPIGDYGVFAVASGTETIDAGARRLIETLVATTEAAFDRLESEASLREREAELEDRNRRLNRQIEITELIRRIDQSLIGADSRDEIERTVPDRLLEAENVSFAWIGTLDASGTRLEPRAWAGPGQEYLDDVSLEADASAEPAVRTALSETPTVVSNVVSGLQDEDWRRHALDRGFQSVISVPLSYAEYTYGVLTIYADEPNAFADLEKTVLTELGEGIANAITAVKTREALHAEQLLELTLRIDGADDLLSRIATATGARVEYEGLGTHSADETLLFFETSGAAVDDVRAALDDLVSVADYRLISEADDTCRFEATVADDVVASRLVRHGGSPRSMRADGDGLTITVDVPTGTDVREFVEMLQEQYGDVELQARRHVERSMQTRSELVTSLFDDLTDRQLEVLRTAYFAGFFDWPRESTGQEIAAMLDVTQPTVNRHLRIGQRRLLAQLFEEESPLLAD